MKSIDDEMTADEITADEMITDEMTADEMTANLVSNDAPKLDDDDAPDGTTCFL